VLLSQAGQVGGRTCDYWNKARELAQQQLYLHSELEKKVQKRMQVKENIAENDIAFGQMLNIVEKVIMGKAHNPYHQAQRDQYAVSAGIFHRIKNVDVVMVLDKSDNVIVFQLANAFRELFTKGKNIEKEIARSIETFSSLQPLPIPDMTRHGLHWINWLAEHPEFDFRNPSNDPYLAKSGVYHFGGHCEIGDPNGKKGVGPTKDSATRHGGAKQVLQELPKFRYSALGACTEVISFLFDLVDPDLLAEYKAIAEQASQLGYIPFQTRQQDDPFVLKAVLVNLMTNEHRDDSDCRYGLAGLAPLGDFQGGDLLLRELGLQIESKSGCVQLIRGRELRHSITKWTGRRFVVVSTNHEAVRRWARRRMGLNVNDSVSSRVNSCFDVNQEDVLPEDQVILSEKERNPERHVGLEHSSSEAESEASMMGVKAPRSAKQEKKRTGGDSSDASAEQSEGLRQKARSKKGKRRRQLQKADSEFDDITNTLE
ncbi:hypothetical protein F4779DRAFT_635797, partial [Xylariaceae sp. FL0662B]